MRDNSDRWQFYQHPSKPIITPADMRYWKRTLEGTLKVGMEFEFNLKDQKGTCRGDNVQCACVHIERNCWRKCVFEEKCSKEPCIDTCANATDKCKSEDCAKCANYEFQCIGVSCVDFMSACFSCTDFNKGCEKCPKRYVPERDPDHIRELMIKEFNPSNNYGKVSESGVVTVTGDGSLLGGSSGNKKGAEIITVGRRVNFWEFYKMSKHIIDFARDHGAFLNERTSSHMHVLSTYYGREKNDKNYQQRHDNYLRTNELEKPMPQIILANFHQLCRRWQNALVWMTTALGDPNHMTRWEKFRVSVLDVSPVTKDMKEIVQEINQKADGHKYGLVDYYYSKFNNDAVERFHVEFREPDSTMCPSWYAAMACLHYAIVIKAVEISQYGLLKVGGTDWMKKAKAMKKIILNGKGGYDSKRVSDTSKLLDNREYFIKESVEMVGQLKNILLKLGPAYEILIKIAQRPVSMRRIDGEKWDDIEKDLSVPIDEIDEMILKINEIADLRIIEDCKDLEEWVNIVAKHLSEDPDLRNQVTENKVRAYVEDKMHEGRMIWSDSLGCIMNI